MPSPPHALQAQRSRLIRWVHPLETAGDIRLLMRNAPTQLGLRRDVASFDGLMLTWLMDPSFPIEKACDFLESSLRSLLKC